MQHPFPMRLLVACPECKRQYDASKLEVESLFRCLCGQTLEVPRPEPHDAAVVRCVSCGGPRQENAHSCGFCGADFTLHERDLHTICPSCMTRVSDRAKYCHHCASPLLPAEAAGEPTEYLCPSCGEGMPLTSRRVESADIGLLECPRCAGLWVNGDEFSLLKDRSRSVSSPMDPEDQTRETTDSRSREATQTGPLYRPCPICRALMNRRNYGRRSGVIIDSCRDHGIWFDAQELNAVLHWIRSGREASAHRREKGERAEEKRQAALKRLHEPVDQGWAQSSRGTNTLAELLRWLTGTLVI